MVPTPSQEERDSRRNTSPPSPSLSEAAWQAIGVAVLFLDDQHIVRYANAAAARLLRQDVHELVERKFEHAVTHNDTTELSVHLPDGDELELEATARDFSWQGRPGHLVTLVNITQHKTRLRHSVQLLETERAFGGFSSRFFQTTRFDDAIADALEDVGRMTEADECYMVAYRRDEQLWELAKSWKAPHVPTERAPITRNSAEFLPWFTSRLFEGRAFWINSPAEVPPEAEREGQFLFRKETRCWLVIPVFLGSDLVGALTLENPLPDEQWHGIDMNLLWALSQIMGKALYHLRVERQLEEQHAFLQQVIDVIPHMLFAKDRDGRYTLANQAMAQFYDVPVDQILGKTDRQLTPYADEAVGFRRVDLEVIGTLQEKGIPEEVNTNARGERRLMWTVKRPLIGSDGLATHVLGVATDITDLVQAEANLRESERRYRQIFNCGNDISFVYRLTTDGKPGPFIEVSDVACQKLGYTRQELMSKTILDICPIDQHPRVLADLVRTRRDESAVGEASFTTHDGRQIPVEISSTALDMGGQPAILAVARDVAERKAAEAERKRLEAQLLQVQKLEAMGRLTNGVAHDYSNLLTAIRGHAEMLRSQLGTDHPAGQHAAQIVLAAQEAADLVHQLQVFGSHGPSQPIMLDVNRILSAMEGMLRRILGEDVQMTVDLGDSLWPVFADPGRLEQALFNIVVNAREAMPGGGRLHIQTRNTSLADTTAGTTSSAASNEFVLVKISDTGMGMNREVQDRIFEPFFTTKSGETPAGGQLPAMGMGLATVYGIVTQHGGHVEVESAPNQGASFFIYLPRGTEPATTGVPPIGEVVGAMAVDGNTILLVEDNDEVRRMVAAMLEDAGFSVLSAADAEEARKMIGSAATGVVLLVADVVLPDTRGPLLADELANLQPGMKVLFISGYTPDTIEESGGLSPEVPFLRKPFTPAELLNRIREVLEPESTGPSGDALP